MVDSKRDTPTNEKELQLAIEEAVSLGNSNDVDRLMAVSLPEEKEEAVEDETLPVEEEKPVEKEDGTSKVEEAKEEAADINAASTPEVDKGAVKVDEVATLKQELHRLKSDAGRMPYVQSRVKELERELRELKLSHTVGSKDSTDPEKVKGIEVPANLKKKIDELREVDPSLADLFEDMTKVLRSENKDTASTVIQTINESERESEEQRFIQEQYSALVQDVPWAPQAFQSNEWKQWKEGLSPGRRALAESTYADEVKLALNAFSQELQAQQGNAQSVPQQVASPPSNDEAEKIKQERERKLQSSGTSKAPTAKAGTQPLNEEAYFEEMYGKIQKEGHLT